MMDGWICGWVGEKKAYLLNMTMNYEIVFLFEFEFYI